MAEPGVYLADVTEGITRIADLPKAKVIPRSRNYKGHKCPRCGTRASRLRRVTRLLHDLGDLVSRCPHDIPLTYSQHHCTRCGQYFNADTSDMASPGSHYTHRVVAVAVRVVVEDGVPYRAASWHLWRDHRVFVPCATIQNWVEASGRKAAEGMAGASLAWALADFSGSIAADELYDGPCCVLSIGDNRRCKRLVEDILDHNLTHEDIQRFFGRFQMLLAARHLTVLGITTDASPRYPRPIATFFDHVPHQRCPVHTIAEITKAVLKAVAKVRKTRAAHLPKLPRGRPASQAAKRRARVQHARRQKIADRFAHRLLFVQHVLTPTERNTLAQRSHGHQELRALRGIPDAVSRLFDRRCRSATALQKLAKLGRRVRRFTKGGKTLQTLCSPNLEKALTFLDDT